MTLFNALILSRLDYCSQLWSPHLIRHIIQIEKVQRSFAKFITRMRDCSYSDRLALLRLYSLQRRRERYCIIYVCKIIEDLVPTFSKPIVCTRRGRYCVVSHVNIGRYGTLAYNSFRWRAIRLFNSNLLDVPLLSVFRLVLNIVDHPCVPGFNNSLDGGDLYQMEDTSW